MTRFDDRLSWHSPIELAIVIKRCDIAKRFVECKANPIHPSLETVIGVPQILTEYFEFGTREYITWLFHQHFLPRDIPGFIDKIVYDLEIFNERCMTMFENVDRNPSHAILTCGNEELIRKFLGKYGLSQLSVRDKAGETALQIATESGDFESVHVLLKFYFE